MAQPTGVVTLLFSDVEGSTKLLERLGTERYAQVLESHRRLMREAFARFDGFEVGTEGDSFFVAFAGAGDAVSAAREGQVALAAADWPDGVRLRVRVGVHTGQPVAGDGNYVGMDVHRAARIMSAAHGGQVLVSQTTATLLGGAGLRDLGPQRLKDLLEPIRLYQLEIEGLPDEFPPVRSLHRSNLPVAAWPLLGREQELAEIRGLVADGVRLVTLTGPGGSGKTRLALQAAGEMSDEFVDGVFFVALAPLRDLSAVRSSVAEALGLAADDDVAGWLESRRVLLVLDNLEHLARVDGVVLELLVGRTALLCTSRGPLRLNGEREFPVDPLPDGAAVELFVNRAAAAGRKVAADKTVAAVCRRLDNLPLAIELAAAQTRLLSPSALLSRLDAALPLLTGGGSDRPERQRTLRATIQWSHELLDPDPQAAFRRLSVFRGSFTLDAAEQVTGAELDHLAALIDQSLIRPLGQERLFMLETLREYARERLDSEGETAEFTLRHAHHYLEELRAAQASYDGPRRPELITWFTDEEDNLRAMLDRLSEISPDDAGVAADLLRRFWVSRMALSEARERLQGLLAVPDLSPEVRAGLQCSLAEIEEWLGHLDAAERAAHNALALAESTGQAETQFFALRSLAWIASWRGHVQEAVRLQTQALEVAKAKVQKYTALATHDLGGFLQSADRSAEARRALLQAVELAHASGNESLELTATLNLAEIELYAHEFETAYRTFERTRQRWQRTGAERTGFLLGMASAALGLDRREEARELFAEALSGMLDAARTSHYDLWRALAGIALAAAPLDLARAAQLLGATSRLRARAEFRLKPEDEELERYFERVLLGHASQPKWTQERSLGAELTLEETIALAMSLPGPQPG